MPKDRTMYTSLTGPETILGTQASLEIRLDRMKLVVKEAIDREVTDLANQLDKMVADLDIEALVKAEVEAQAAAIVRAEVTRHLKLQVSRFLHSLDEDTDVRISDWTRTHIKEQIGYELDRIFRGTK